MRTRFSFLFASIFFAVGCGSSDDTAVTPPADTGTGADATTDTAKPDTGTTPTDTGSTPTDTGSTMEDAAGIKCGSTVCGMGQVCCASGDPDAGFMLACTTGTSCGDAGATLACDGPEDCPSGSKICCATVNVEGTGLMCTFKSGAAECKASCSSYLPTGCPGTATVRRCHAPSDCTEGEYNKCCLFESGGTSAEFCANAVAAFAAKSCK